MFKVKTYNQLKILQIYTAVALILSLFIICFGYAKTVAYTTKQVSLASNNFVFTLSGVEFNIDNVIKNEETNQLCIISSTNKLNKLAYTDGAQFFYASDVEQLTSDVYIYPSGKMIIILKSIDPDFLKSTQLSIVIRMLSSMVRPSDTTTGDATDSKYDQARLSLNPSAQTITSTTEEITVSTAYKTILSTSSYDKVYADCSSKLDSISSDFIQFNEYNSQLADLNLSFSGLPTELDGDAVSEDSTELITDYVFDNGVNFKYTDVDSFLSDNNIQSYQQLKDYISVLENTSCKNSLNRDELTFTFIDSGEVATSENTTPNQYTYMVRLTNTIDTIYADKVDYQTKSLLSVLKVKLSEMQEENEYSTVKIDVFKI